MDISRFRKEYRAALPDVPIFLDPLLSSLLGKPSIDILGLDSWAKRNGYVEDGKTSLNDFIGSKYGDEALAFIDNNL